MKTIRTARLQLREFVKDDFDDMFTRDLEWHVEHQQATPRNFYHLALELPASQRVIGYCGLQFEPASRHEAEIGYTLHRDYWGQGYMTEAARALIDYGFCELQVHRI